MIGDSADTIESKYYLIVIFKYWLYKFKNKIKGIDIQLSNVLYQRY